MIGTFIVWNGKVFLILLNNNNIYHNVLYVRNTTTNKLIKILLIFVVCDDKNKIKKIQFKIIYIYLCL